MIVRLYDTKSHGTSTTTQGMSASPTIQLEEDRGNREDSIYSIQYTGRGKTPRLIVLGTGREMEKWVGSLALKFREIYQGKPEKQDLGFEDDVQPDWVSPPGDTIKDLLDEQQKSTALLAQAMGWTVQQVQDLIDGKTSLSYDTGLLLGEIFGTTVAFWTTREFDYRECLARLNSKEPEEHPSGGSHTPPPETL